MEQMMQGAPDVGATTPDAGAMQVDVGQPAQPQGEAPEGFQPEGQQPELTPQEEFFLQAGTGTVYKTKEAAIAGIEEKDRIIKQFLESQRSQPTPAPQPQVDPQAAASTAIATLQAEFEQDYRNDPKYRDYSPEAIAEQAYIDAKNAYRIEQRMMQQYEQRQQQASFAEFERSTPDLQTPLAKELWERSKQAGMPYQTPYALLDAVHAEMYRRGMQPNQPQAGHMAVQGALQNQQRPIFGQPQGTGHAPSSGLMSETVRKQVEFAQTHGYTGEALERIKQRAIENEARMSKR